MSNELADRLEAWLAMSGLGIGASGDTVREAITALRAEPVAWFHNNYGEIELSRIKRVGWEPLYAAPSRETDQRECSPAPVDEHGLTELRSGAPTPTSEPALSAEQKDIEDRTERVEANAQYWYEAARNEPDRDRAVMHCAQAMFAYKNAFYAFKQMALSFITARDEGIEVAAEEIDVMEDIAPGMRMLLADRIRALKGGK